MPFNPKDYPDNWKTEIVPAIKDRANHCCESCGVPNYSVGYREPDGKFVAKYEDCGSYKTARQIIWEIQLDVDQELIVIVLTVAHVHDPDPMNCEPGNLLALCQRCYNKMDAVMRAKNAAKTRQRKRDKLNGQTDLFEDAA